MKINTKVHTLVQVALIAAVYAVLTVFLPLQYGMVQLRVAEVLTLLCFYNRRYVPALILGCFIANLFSPFGWIDWVMGTAATAIAVIPMTKIKNIWLAGLLPVISNAVIVGAVITYFSGAEINAGFGFVPIFLLNAGFVALGEFIVIVPIGIPMFKYGLEKNKAFMNLVTGFDSGKKTI